MTENTVMTVVFADVLEDHYRRAADHIEANGWYRGTWFESYDSPDDLPTDCPSCILGSLLVACKSENITDFMAARRSLYYGVGSTYLDFLEGEEDRNFVGSIVEWNDNMAESAEEVINRLRNAADDVKYQNSSFLAFVQYVRENHYYGWEIRYRDNT